MFRKEKLYIKSLAFSLILLVGNIALGQNVYNGNVTLSTQAEVDAFGANDYTSIDGSLVISGNDISSLSSLLLFPSRPVDSIVETLEDNFSRPHDLLSKSSLFLRISI